MESLTAILNAAAQLVPESGLFFFFSCYSPFFTQANRAVSPKSSQFSGQPISMCETSGDSYACNDEKVNVENPHRFIFQGLLSYLNFAL